MFEKITLAVYPECTAYYDGTNLEQRVVVTPDMDSGSPFEIAAALGVSFGTAGRLALWFHVLMVEFYVSATPSSYELVCGGFRLTAL